MSSFPAHVFGLGDQPQTARLRRGYEPSRRFRAHIIPPRRFVHRGEQSARHELRDAALVAGAREDPRMAHIHGTRIRLERTVISVAAAAIGLMLFATLAAAQCEIPADAKKLSLCKGAARDVTIGPSGGGQCTHEDGD